jgi:hypothetical protein
VLYETWDRVRREWGPGEEVTLDWRDGTFLVNGFRHLPHDPPPPWKVEVLRRLYGEAPFIQNYVATAEGDSVARWNAAARALEQMHRDVYTGAQRTYGAALDSLGSADRAAHAAAVWIEQSELVDSTAISTRMESTLMIFWKGERYGINLLLDDDRDMRSGKTYLDPCTKDLVCMIVRLMEAGLANPGTYRVEFVRGNVNMFGSAGVQFSTGGSPSTDPRYDYNPYVEASTPRQEHR